MIALPKLDILARTIAANLWSRKTWLAFGSIAEMGLTLDDTRRVPLAEIEGCHNNIGQQEAARRCAAT